MIRSQGTRSLDPYGELQLQPHAARDLIIEAYWTIVARMQQEAATPEEARDLISALNDAYAILMHDESRKEYDSARGYDAVPPTLVRLQPIDPRVPSVEMAVIADGSDYYRLLAIERRAEPGIIRAAHRSMLRMASDNTIRDHCLRDLLEEVYETLSDPERRAEYDATLPPERRRPLESEPAQALVAELAPVETPLVEGRMIQEIAAPPDAFQEQADALDELRHALGGDEEVEEQARDGGLLARLRGAANGHHEEPDATIIEPVIRAPKPKRLNEQQRTIAAEGDRLLSLRDDALRPPAAEAPAPAPAPAPAHAAAPRLIIATEGGREIGINGNTLSIGSAPGADIVIAGDDVRASHAQVWLHRESLALRVADGANATVNGEPLLMPLIFLDDGDEVAIGAHRLVFRGYAPE